MQMRRRRKGSRAHALVMGGDATPISGPVTVRIYCAATQQRLQVGLLQFAALLVTCFTWFSDVSTYASRLCGLPFLLQQVSLLLCCSRSSLHGPLQADRQTTGLGLVAVEAAQSSNWPLQMS